VLANAFSRDACTMAIFWHLIAARRLPKLCV
jgi:hypothetical protein